MKNERICGIYRIRNIIDNKCYIGSSINIYYRWETHISMLRNNRHYNPKLQEAWNKFGEDAFEFSIIEECQSEEKFIYEQKWYDYYKSYDENYGYNGSQNAISPSVGFTYNDIENGKSIISYDKFSLLMKYLCDTDMSLNEISNKLDIGLSFVFAIYNKNVLCEATKNFTFRIRPTICITNNILEEDDIKVIIERLLNGDWPNDIAVDFNVHVNTIYDIRNYRTWTNITEDVSFDDTKGKRQPVGKSVDQYDLNGNYLNTYFSARIANKETGVSYKNISQVCNGEKKTAGGYVWRFSGEQFDKYNVENLSKYLKNMAVDQYDKMSKKLIATFSSIAEAKRKTNINTIDAVISGRAKTAGGYYWTRHGEPLVV